MTESIVSNLWNIQATHYARIASSTIVLYDHLITLQEEVELIWKACWSLVTILFLMNRYYILAALFFDLYVTFSPNITNTVRGQYFHWEGWTGLVAAILAQGILQVRIYALYSLNKKILAVMLICYFACSAVSAWMWTDLEILIIIAVPIPGGKFCIPSRAANFYSFWIPVLSFEFMLFFLAVFRGIGEYRLAGSSMFRGGRSLVGILIRDSVFYFLVIAVAYLISLLFWLSAPSGLVEAPVGYSPAMSCVLANRVLFNIREGSRVRSPMFTSSET
ncbi:hypothetical protein GALMADRAFT_282816 [Galerina marginata CBS 339.88]|uniref:DUF6533 domain-containing protein n=1 Tax=Galerina marginata (strain CBS 339.88) TaxID=685588 RepID=A0A067SE06_GALM3|nr:hypothetical protein GALMADRAFT_282816 [Galerina marginata CBS 339.88]